MYIQAAIVLHRNTPDVNSKVGSHVYEYIIIC